MSSPKASTRTKAAAKAADVKSGARKPVAAKAKSAKAAAKPSLKEASTKKAPAQVDPSPAQKAAFLKAMAAGVKHDSAASRALVQKKGSPFAATQEAVNAPAPAPKVEVLRRIPAPAAIIDTPESKTALALAALIEKAIDSGDLGKVQPHAQQALVAALCKLYAAHAEAGERFNILGQRSATVAATDVMVVCGALLKAVDLQVFELGMWQSWSSG